MDRADEFIEACQLGQADHLRTFFISSEHFDVDCTDEHYNTGLQVAAANGHKDVVTLLLQNGALVDKSNSYGWTPLMQAARQGHTTIVGILISNGASVNATNRFKNTGTALLCAVRSGVLSCVKMLLDNGAAPSPLTSEVTPLIVAAQYNYTSIVKYLIDVGFDVNQMAKPAGLNALMFAASNGHKGMAQLLVECRANMKAVNVCGRNALDIAISRGKKQVRCYLSENTKSGGLDLYEQEESDIFEAITNGNLNSVQQFLSSCPSLLNRARKQDGATPLTLAAMLGNLCMIEYLVANGALVDARDTNGWTPLMHAVFHGCNKVALCLLQNGADKYLKENNGYRALEIGALVANSDVNLLRCLTPLCPDGYQTMHLSGPTSGNDTLDRKQKWLHQLGGYFQQLKIKRSKWHPTSKDEAIGLTQIAPSWNWKHPATKVNYRKLSRANDDPRNVFDNCHRPNSDNSAQDVLFRLNTFSPCRLAPPSRSLKPIVIPVLSPYDLDTSNSRRTMMPAAITLPECFSMAMPPEAVSSTQSNRCEDADNAISSQIITDSPTVSEKKDDLYDILESTSLEKFYSLFVEEEVDASAFVLMSEQDLIDLGIVDTSSRQKLMAVISKLKK